MNDFSVDKGSTKNKGIFLLNYRLFVILLLAVPLYLSNNSVAKSLGYMSIICIFLFGIIYGLFSAYKIKLTSTWVWYFIYSLYNLIMLIRTPTFKAFYDFMLQFLLLLFMCLLSSLSLNEKVLNTIFRYGKFLYFILLIPGIMVALSGTDLAIRMFDKYFSFVIYKFMFICTFFLLVNDKHKVFKVLFFTFVFLLMTERTSALVLLIIYFVYLVIERLRKSRLAYKALFDVVFFAILGFTFLYVQLQYMDIGNYINLFFRKYTGGNFFSGRHIIWGAVFKYLNQSALFGYGIDNGVLALEGITKSAHNTYLHLLLQGGWIGILFFFMFLRSIWKRYYKNLDDNIVRLSAAYMIGILIFISFEVTLVGNAVGLGLFMWFILGIGIIKGNSNEPH